MWVILKDVNKVFAMVLMGTDTAFSYIKSTTDFKL